MYNSNERRGIFLFYTLSNPLKYEEYPVFRVESSTFLIRISAYENPYVFYFMIYNQMNGDDIVKPKGGSGKKDGLSFG